MFVIRRPIAALLAAQLSLALTACGASPTGTLNMAPVAPAAAPAAIAAAAPKAVAPLAPVNAPRVAVVATTPERAAAPLAPLAPPAPPAKPQTFAPIAEHRVSAGGLFDRDFDKAAIDAAIANGDKAPASGDDAEVRGELSRQYGTTGTPSVFPGSAFPWGPVGIGLAALLGIPAVGYAIYTGMVGSKDLMYPEKDTYAETPSLEGMAYTRTEFPSHDGLKLVGWYVPAAVPTTKGILMLHGHTVNKNWMFHKYGAMLHQNYNLFLYDSRYHGESEGKFTTLGHYEKKDAVLAFDQLRNRGNTSIGVMGESMGGAVAIDAGADVLDCKAVWADCAFDSLHDAIAPRAKNRNYPLPDYVAWNVVNTVSIRGKANVRKDDPINWVSKISPRPLYLVHGQADPDTTPMNSDKLFDKAQEPKTIWRAPGAVHAETWKLFPVEYKTRVNAFFDAAL